LVNNSSLFGFLERREKKKTKKIFFEVSLEESIKNSKDLNSNGYPFPFIHLLEFIENNLLDVPFMYRMGASRDLINEIKEKYESKKNIDLSNYYDHDVLLAFKTFLREIEGNLIDETTSKALK